MHGFTFDMLCLEKTTELKTLPPSHFNICKNNNSLKEYKYFLLYFTDSVIFRGKEYKYLYLKWCLNWCTECNDFLGLFTKKKITSYIDHAKEA